jgi:hypothetical protein
MIASAIGQGQSGSDVIQNGAGLLLNITRCQGQAVLHWDLAGQKHKVARPNGPRQRQNPAANFQRTAHNLLFAGHSAASLSGSVPFPSKEDFRFFAKRCRFFPNANWESGLE